MIEIGVQTRNLYPERDAYEAMTLIKQAGFTRIDFNLDAFFKSSDLYSGNMNQFFEQSEAELTEFFSPLKSAMQKEEIRFSQMHAPYPFFVDGRPEINEYTQDVVMKKSIQLAKILDVPYVVVHPFKIGLIGGKKLEYEENIRFYKKMIPLIKGSNVKVCLENQWCYVAGRAIEAVCSNATEVVRYIDELNDCAGEELFGFCLDTGHLQLTKRNPYSFIKTLDHRLKILHIHENDGVDDFHQLPFSFGCTKDEGFDWNGFIRGLIEIEFDGTLSFETLECVHSFPQQLTGVLLETIYSIGEYLREEITR